MVFDRDGFWCKFLLLRFMAPYPYGHFRDPVSGSRNTDLNLFSNSPILGTTASSKWQPRFRPKMGNPPPPPTHTHSGLFVVLRMPHI